MYNCEKLNKFMHDKNISKKELAEELSVNSARISELCRGKEIIPLLDRICNKYNVHINDFYGDYIEPIYMAEVRRKINHADNKGANCKEIGVIAGVNYNVVRDIQNHPTFSCSENIANKIIHSDLDKI